jgi:hypothetical protein
MAKGGFRSVRSSVGPSENTKYARDLFISLAAEIDAPRLAVRNGWTFDLDDLLLTHGTILWGKRELRRVPENGTSCSPRDFQLPGAGVSRVAQNLCCLGDPETGSGGSLCVKGAGELF